MSDILLVSSSAMGKRSVSRGIALHFIEAARQIGDLAWRERDLADLGHIDATLLAALRTDPAARSSEQAELVRRADTLIEEVEAARLIAITCPIYAHSIPSRLKAWLEHVNRQGRTFRHGKDGHEGLLTGKKVCIVVTRGSEPAARMRDYAEVYLETVLESFGMSDVRFVHAHQTAHEDGPRQIADAARQAETLGREWATS